MSEDNLEGAITSLILEHTLRDWKSFIESDIVIVGSGPSGLTAAKYLADKGFRVVVFERRLSFGGGIGGGGMLFHKVVIRKEAEDILKDFRVRYSDIGNNLLVADAAELSAKLASGALDSGAKIVLGVNVEDVIIRYKPLRVAGVVTQWSAVTLSGLHVDPLLIPSKAVIDATGHDAEVLRIVSRKVPEANLKLRGESSAYSRLSEELVVDKTGKVLPGLYVTGMAVAALYGLPRMGPIFSGMLLSGKKVAEQIIKDLGRD